MAVARQAWSRRGGWAVLEICAVAALYYGSAELGLLQQLVRHQITPLWPPSGIALASLLLLGPRVWPGIALGAFLANIALGPSLPAVLAIAAGNTLAPVCSYALLRRAGFRSDLNRLRDALALIFFGAFTGMLVSATVGSGTLALTGVLDADDLASAWSVWWTGDAMGVLAVTPLLLLLRSARWPRGVSLSRWAEVILLVAATVCVGFVETGDTPLLFLGFPLLIWAGFRFGLPGSAPCALAVSTFAIVAAGQKSGPFAGHDLFTNMLTLQAFNGSASLTALLLGVAIGERARTEREITQACRHLAEMATRIATSDNRPALPARRNDQEAVSVESDTASGSLPHSRDDRI
ncbi:MASE1 domain-containing protein [Streptomyces collinus]|uniref:MASE1 domain-containing protein n=1 Tax=Streptomyces collinus TaxID=42684 RepID=UPI0033E463FE